MNGLRTIGYTDQVVIPIEFTPRNPNAPLALSGRVDLGVCKDICIPVNLSFSATLSPNITKTDPLIRAALKQVPMPAHKAGVKTVTCAIEPISDGLRVTATLKLPSTGKGEIAVIEAPNQNIWVSEATVKRRGNTLTATAEMVPPSNAPFMLDRSKNPHHSDRCKPRRRYFRLHGIVNSGPSPHHHQTSDISHQSQHRRSCEKHPHRSAHQSRAVTGHRHDPLHRSGQRSLHQNRA